MSLTKEKVAGLLGRFTWGFGSEFFIETKEGNFIWKDPSYHGSNTIEPTDMNCKQWTKRCNIPYGRDKGEHVIGSYCGTDFTLA